MSLPTFVTLFSDNFNRANENPLNPTNYQTIDGLPGGDQLQIISDTCRSTVGVDNEGTANVIAIPQQTDCWASIKASHFTSAADYGILLRGDSAFEAGY